MWRRAGGKRTASRPELRSAFTLISATAEPDAVAAALAAELGTLAGWLGLGAVTVARHGNLSRALAAAVRRA